MEIHEYQIKELLKKHGIPVLPGGVAYTPDEAVRQAEKMNASAWMLKAQIYDNKRFAGFFDKTADDPICGTEKALSLSEVRQKANRMLGGFLATPVTYGISHEVQRVYVEKFCEIQKSFSISFFVNRQNQEIAGTVLSEDGRTMSFTVLGRRMTAVLLRKLTSFLKLKSEENVRVSKLLRQLYDLFAAYGALALEADPIVMTPEGIFCVLDARIVFDSDALFRHPDIARLVEVKTGLEREALAHRNNFRYTKLNGNIACLVNGAGLGLATVDLVRVRGGEVACLIDVGTEPSKEAVSKAFKLALSEPDIDGVLVNIFGGITRCDIIAQGIISASHEIAVGMPLVVRMDGTNARMGSRLLFESHLPFIVVKEMDEAVDQVVCRVREISE